MLKIGDSVKVCVNNEENLWVAVTEINESQPKKFKGKIDITPTKTTKVNFGDSIEFNEENVISVL